MGISQLKKAVSVRRTIWLRGLEETKYDMRIVAHPSPLLMQSLNVAPTWTEVCADMRAAVANQDRAFGARIVSVS